MLFDDFVNKILKEATFSTQPKDEKQAPTTTPKDGLSAITGVTTKGTPVNQPQATQQGQVAQQPQKPAEDSSTDGDGASSEAMEKLADVTEKGNKQMEDFLKKIISTMTAQKAQTPATTSTQTTTPQGAPTTSVPNA